MASRSWNRVELIGNLTRDPELRFTPNGSAVATFGIATNRTYMSEGERKEEVDFHKLVAWGKLAELCSQLLKKGARVFVSGRLQYREWEGQDGNRRRDAEIVLEDMIILTPKNGSYPASEEVAEEAAIEIPEEMLEEEKPAKKEPSKIESKKADETDKKPKADENISSEETDDLPF